jgi:hypothetical protein
MTNWRHLAQQLQSGLPKPLNERRCRLLPKILREWSRVDLKRHLSHESRAQLRARIKKLETVKKDALQLMNTLDGLDEDGRTAIVAQMIIAERGGYTPGLFRVAEFDARIDRLREETEFLAKLAAIEPDKYYSQFGSRRPRNVPAYLVLQDAAAIYEWLTGRRAARGVDRSTGLESGPFFRFTSILWPVVFGRGSAGLPSAVKNWDEAKRQYRELSPLITNIAMRHPTWGIFEP